MRDYNFTIRRADKSLGNDCEFRDTNIAAAILTWDGADVRLLGSRLGPDPRRPAGTCVFFTLTCTETSVTVNGQVWPFFPGLVEMFRTANSDFKVTPGNRDDAREQLLDVIETSYHRLSGRTEPYIRAEAKS